MIYLTKLLSFCRKMLDLENQNKDLLATIARREESMHQANVCIDVLFFIIIVIKRYDFLEITFSVFSA